MVVSKKIVFVFFVFLFFTEQQISAQKKLENYINSIYDKLEGDSAKPQKSILFIIPIWGVYPETGWQLGLSAVCLFHLKNDSITRPSIVRLNSFITEKDQFSIRPYVDIFTSQNKFNIRASYTYTKFIEYYWGIGNNTNDATKELYDFTLNRFQIRGTYQFYKNMYAGLQFQTTNMGDMIFHDTILKNSTVAGAQGSFTSGLGLALSFDNRKQIYFPLNGYFVDATLMFHNNYLGSDFAFTNLIVDARKYIHLWNKNVLAIQAYGNFNSGDVPFRQLATLGSESYMRGYYNGRFRDMHAATFQAELRKQIWGPFSCTLFASFGNVSNQASTLLNNIKPNYGIGFRCLAIKKENLNIRIDYGRGENGIQGFYFTMNEAF